MKLYRFCCLEGLQAQEDDFLWGWGPLCGVRPSIPRGKHLSSLVTQISQLYFTTNGPRIPNNPLEPPRIPF